MALCNPSKDGIGVSSSMTIYAAAQEISHSHTARFQRPIKSNEGLATASTIVPLSGCEAYLVSPLNEQWNRPYNGTEYYSTFFGDP